MSEHHHHEIKGKNLFITIILNIVITVSQILGGILSGSLALLSDALHNFSDVMALIIAWWANKISLRNKTSDKTYGYKRAQIVAALFNGAVLVGIGFFLIVEAISRLQHPEPIGSNLVIYLALLSIVLNAASVLLIKDDSHGNLNIKAAYLHLLTDVMTSIAVLIGGLLMKYYQLFWVDPLVTIIIAIYLIQASYSLITESVSILMQSTPKSVDLQDIENTVEQIKGLKNIHHIHLWQLDDHQLILEAHLDFDEDLPISKATQIESQLVKVLAEKFAITHVTLQAEYNVDDDKGLFCTH
ncbi:MAG TPA: cation transporter [Aeromonadales bacterium]|nr:cation transporter [Aeromonadales bacterium]